MNNTIHRLNHPAPGPGPGWFKSESKFDELCRCVGGLTRLGRIFVLSLSLSLPLPCTLLRDKKKMASNQTFLKTRQTDVSFSFYYSKKKKSVLPGPTPDA